MSTVKAKAAADLVTAAPLERGLPLPEAAQGSALAREPGLRAVYAQAALAQLPRLFTALDRNSLRATHGCFDREYWHVRARDFPSEMFQEGVWALAMLHALPMPENRWFQAPQLKDWAAAGLRFSARTAHADGSCDDYYPQERALGAAVFSLRAAAKAYRLLQLQDDEILQALHQRAKWIAGHSESGKLSNHQAMAACALVQVHALTCDDALRHAAEEKIDRVLAWQSPEGWFQEYGGADLGYQTVTIDCLAEYARLTGSPRLKVPLDRAVAFCHLFLGPGGQYGSCLGSRGTLHFYPRGFEQLAAENAQAADLADAFLKRLACGQVPALVDERMYIHRMVSLLAAYQDWSPTRAPAAAAEIAAHNATWLPGQPGTPKSRVTWLPHAGWMIARTQTTQVIAIAKRAGAVQQAAVEGLPVVDAGLVLQFADGRLASSGKFRAERAAVFHQDAETGEARLTVTSQLHWLKQERMSPIKLVLFRLGLMVVRQWGRTLVRRMLQKRLITGAKPAPATLTRTIVWKPDDEPARVEVNDELTLSARHLPVVGVAIPSEQHWEYIVAADVYSPELELSVCWLPADGLTRLNETGRLCWQRRLGQGELKQSEMEQGELKQSEMGA